MKKAKATRSRAPSLLPFAYCLLSFALLADVFPVPGLVKVRAEAEARGVLHQPAISLRLRLNGAVVVLGADRLAADVQVERAPGEVRAVDRQARAPAVGRLRPQLRLVLGRAHRRDDFEILLAVDDRTVGCRRRDHLLVSRISPALDLAQRLGPRRV